jgi:hypothetical protein
MIKNIGYKGAHSNYKKGQKIPKYFGAQAYEIEFPIKHPKYVIDDKYYGREYDKLLNHRKLNPLFRFFILVKKFFNLVFTGRLIKYLKNKFKHFEER